MSTRRTNRNQGAPVGAPDGTGAQDGPRPVPGAENDAADALVNPPPPGNAGPQAVEGAPEPDDEPNPGHARAGEGNTVRDGVEKRGKKIDIRNVRMEHFSGAVPHGAYDSGVRDWWDQFADQVDDAQILAGQEWSEAAKKSVLSIFLSDTARRWLKIFRTGHPTATFEYTENALVKKFRPNLTDQEITARIYSEGKRASETYQEYADRLLRMADGLSGGIANVANAQHALGTFLRLAWPQRKDVVHSHIHGQKGSPTTLTHAAVEFLSELAQSDGRLEDYKRRKLADGSRGQRIDAKPKTDGTRNVAKTNGPGGKAHSAVVERKRKPTKMPRRGGIVCYICNEEGHTAKYHRQHLSKASSDDNETNARGNMATAGDGMDEPAGSSVANSEEDSASRSDVRWSPILVDSGASHHLTSQYTCFEATDDNVVLAIKIADGRTVVARAKGRLHVKVLVQNSRGYEEERDFVVENVYYVPELPHTLLSVSALWHAGYTVSFGPRSCTIAKGSSIKCIARLEGGVYSVVTGSRCGGAHKACGFTAAALGRSLEMLHRRLGHVNYETLQRMAKSGTVNGIRVATGPIAASINGNRYFMVAVWRDYVQTYALKHKTDATNMTKRFLAMIERQAEVPATAIKVLQTTEFLNKDFRKLAHVQGILLQHTTPYTSFQNGVAERSIRTVTETEAAMLVESGLPHRLWEYALQHATYIRNRIPRQDAAITPHERIFGRRPDVSTLPIFGQAVVARVPDQLRRKLKHFLNTRGQLGAFIGCAEDIEGFYLYAKGSQRSIFASRDVTVVDRMLFEVDPDVEDDDVNNEDP